MKKIYIDFDDVLCETARALLEIANEEFGKNVAYDDITAFDPEKVLDIEPEQVNTLLEIAHKPEYLMAYPLISHAPSALTEMNRKGYDIHIVTGRPPQTRLESEKWLVKHQIPFHEIHFVNKYDRDTADYEGPQTLTLDQIARMNFAFAVEDSAEMATYISDRMGIPVFLLDRPWNRPLPPRDNIFRCHGWIDILRKFNDHNGPVMEEAETVERITAGRKNR